MVFDSQLNHFIVFTSLTTLSLVSSPYPSMACRFSSSSEALYV